MPEQHPPEDQAPESQAPPYVPPEAIRRPLDLERFSIRGRKL